ncbi:hypothetical protein F383_19016 [Gossypium arboreum]|uniref:Uncharacterized protein n=1 Tax=Gossypium arboreum TaxID=29729 RepID=A0A0B0NP19_GOSAR|nr:hypothetical protein F383_19016 [Gossypium arboreum]
MVLYVNHKSMPMSQTWSYTITHIGILCHDGTFRRQSLSMLSQFHIFIFNPW